MLSKMYPTRTVSLLGSHTARAPEPTWVISPLHHTSLSEWDPSCAQHMCYRENPNSTSHFSDFLGMSMCLMSTEGPSILANDMISIDWWIRICQQHLLAHRNALLWEAELCSASTGKQISTPRSISIWSHQSPRSGWKKNALSDQKKQVSFGALSHQCHSVSQVLVHMCCIKGEKKSHKNDPANGELYQPVILATVIHQWYLSLETTV